MNVSGVEPAVVYLPPQAITPLSASKEPIALALVARTEMAELKAAEAAISAAEKALTALGAADKAGLNASEKQRTVAQAEPTTGVVFAGRVDVYA